MKNKRWEFKSYSKVLKRRSVLLTNMLVVNHLKENVYRCVDGTVHEYLRELTESSDSIYKYRQFKEDWKII